MKVKKVHVMSVLIVFVSMMLLSYFCRLHWGQAQSPQGKAVHTLKFCHHLAVYAPLQEMSKGASVEV